MAKATTTVKVSEQSIEHIRETLETTPKGQEIQWSGGDKSAWNLFFIYTEDMDKFRAMFPDESYTIIGF